jgi:FHA domain
MPTLVINQGARAGSEHPVDGEVTVGREQGSADLVIEDPGVSRRHARFLASGGAVTVEDLGSSNGTFVNGERISGSVELGAGDEVQLGGTVLGIEGADAATALMPPGTDATEEHPGPAPRGPAPAQPSPSRGPAPRRLAPHPQQESNLPALAAVFLGPLSILLVLFSSGAAFLVSLPCAIAAIVLGSVGMRKVDRGETESFRGLAHLGRITGIIGVVLSTLALIAFVLVAALLDTTEDSLSGVIDRIQEEIEGVEVPDVETPDTGGDSGGAEAP